MSAGKLVAYNGEVSWKFSFSLGELKKRKKKQKEKKVRMKLFLGIPRWICVL